MPRIAEYLPLMAVITKGIEDEFSARTVPGVIDAVRTMYSMIETHDTRVDAFTARATEWLIQNSGTDSWDARRVSRYAKELENEISGEKLRQAWACGDCADLISDLENESVRLVLTDPPYGVKYQSNHRRKPHNVIAGDNSVDEAMDVLSAMLTAIEPKLEADAHLMIFCSWRTEHRVRAVVQSTGYSVRGSYIWDKQAATAGDLNGTLGSSHERIVHAVKGKPLVYERDRDVLPYARVPTDRHPTEKPVPLLKRLIETMTARRDLVVDPFGGVASTLVAAKECGRGYWGCEFDERFHAIGGQRLAATGEGD